MINAENLMQVKAFARQDGLLLSIVWMAGFACAVYAPELPWGSLLALSTPFLVGWRLVKFRNYALGGAISLRRGYAFSAYTMLYAATLFALAQYLYFRFLDGGRFLAVISEGVRTLETVYQGNAAELRMIEQSLGMMQSVTPIEWAFVFLTQNAAIAAVISLPIAALCARRTCKTRDFKRHTSIDK